MTAFLNALPHAREEEFVSVPSFGTFRAKHVRRGMERGVLAVHWTGLGFAVVQPPEHGICPHCAKDKRSLCDHCACSMCSWFRTTDERASPRVSRERFQQLLQRLKTFEVGATAPQTVTVPALDDEV